MSTKLILTIDEKLPSGGFDSHWELVTKGKFKGYHALKAVAYVAVSRGNLLGQVVAWGKNKSGDIVLGTAKGVFQPFDSRNGEYNTGFGDAYKMKAYLKEGSSLTIFVRVGKHVVELTKTFEDFQRDGIYASAFVVIDNSEPSEPIPDPVPEPDVVPYNDRFSGEYLLLSYIKGMWPIAVAQSLLMFKWIGRIFTHVQSGIASESMDLSAEPHGLVYVDRAESLKKTRGYIMYKIPLTNHQLEMVKQIFLEEEGKRYDYYFYFRWFFNTMLILTMPLLVYSLITWILFSGPTWYLWAFGIAYGPVNGILLTMSRGFLFFKKTWACAKFESYMLKKAGIADYQYVKDITAMPQDMVEKTACAISGQFSNWSDVKFKIGE